eukprot:111979-Pelagomonas_calceolata.AAC.2
MIVQWVLLISKLLLPASLASCMAVLHCALKSPFVCCFTRQKKALLLQNLQLVALHLALKGAQPLPACAMHSKASRGSDLHPKS